MANYTDTGSIIGHAVPSGIENRVRISQGTLNGHAIPSALNIAVFVDAGKPTGHSIPSAKEALYVDINTIIGRSLPYGRDVQESLGEDFEIITDYQLGIRREVINALRDVFSATYPDPQFLGPGNKSRVYIGTEFPIKETQYPSIFITYSEGIVKNAGIGNFEMVAAEDGTTQKVLHWRFEGALNFNIFAKTTVDREMLAAGLLNILAFGSDAPALRVFWDEIYDADWVAMELIGDNPRPLGDSTEIAPWGADERVYTRGYQVAVMGDFWTRPLSGGLIRISDIDIFPYRYDQAVPQGNQDGPNATVPWQP